jgi:hypothetical protein
MERIYLQGLQDPSPTNGYNPNNIRREISRYFIHKKTISSGNIKAISKNITNRNRNINEFKKLPA